MSTKLFALLAGECFRRGYVAVEREALLEPMLRDRLSQHDLIDDLLCLHFVAVDQHGAVPSS